MVVMSQKVTLSSSPAYFVGLEPAAPGQPAQQNPGEEEPGHPWSQHALPVLWDVAEHLCMVSLDLHQPIKTMWSPGHELHCVWPVEVA